MRALILFIFCQTALANTLTETQTAVGIANTLQGTAQGNPQGVLNKVKETTNNYEQAQQQKQAEIPEPISSQPIHSNNPTIATPNETQQIPPQSPTEPQPIHSNNPTIATPNETQQIPPQSPTEPQPIHSNNPTITGPDEAPQRLPQSLPDSLNGSALDNLSLSEQEREQIHSLNESISSPSHADSSGAGFETAESNMDSMNLEEENIEITESYFTPEKIVSIQDERPIDYKSSTQIFYKQDCLPSQSKCERNGAVLTNIKSVIFNYAHSRGSFAEKN